MNVGDDVTPSQHAACEAVARLSVVTNEFGFRVQTWEQKWYMNEIERFGESLHHSEDCGGARGHPLDRTEVKAN